MKCSIYLNRRFRNVILLFGTFVSFLFVLFLFIYKSFHTLVISLIELFNYHSHTGNVCEVQL